MREQVLHVPLVVAGLAGVAPAVIDTPVQLADVTPAVLGWIGLPAPDGLAGRPLPTDPRAPARTPLVAAEFYDIGRDGERSGSEVADLLIALTARMRRGCDPGQRVFGDMRALVRYPLKLAWYAKYPAQLYDLQTDGDEQHDLAGTRPAVVAELTEELGELIARHPHIPRPERGASQQENVSKDVLDRLRALGYVGDDAGHRAPEPSPAEP